MDPGKLKLKLKLNLNTKIKEWPFFLFADYPHNPYNGVICNDTITATGVFSSKELWRLSKGNVVNASYKIDLKLTVKYAMIFTPESLTL